MRNSVSLTYWRHLEATTTARKCKKNTGQEHKFWGVVYKIYSTQRFEKLTLKIDNYLTPYVIEQWNDRSIKLKVNHSKVTNNQLQKCWSLLRTSRWYKDGWTASRNKTQTQLLSQTLMRLLTASTQTQQLLFLSPTHTHTHTNALVVCVYAFQASLSSDHLDQRYFKNENKLLLYLSFQICLWSFWVSKYVRTFKTKGLDKHVTKMY